MTTTAMNATYINALLADASYVNLASDINTRLAARLTQPLADFITDNFEVLNQQPDSLLDGFSATVWRGKSTGDYAGQVYVSMRGTNPGVDFIDDAVLATTGVAYDQLASMVNWWMRATATAGQQVAQVKVFKVIVGGVEIRQIVAADTALSSGELTGSNAINAIHSINGHSLGGYLATAFERIFGGTYPIIEAGQLPIEHITTFNSAGYNNIGIIGANINTAFNNIAAALGLPTGGFNPALQTNYYGENGLEVTTNEWRPIGFNQIGTRVALYQEDTLGQVVGPIVDPFSNHYMYKITDFLALGDAISKLDNNFTIDQLNGYVKSSSNEMNASYEKLLDGLRQTILGGSITDTLIGDTSSTESGSSRVNYHSNLKALTDMAAFQAFAGKITLVTSPSSASEAREDFGAFLSLFYLTPFALKGNDSATDALLRAIHTALSDKWIDDNNLSDDDIASGRLNFSDMYLNDRAGMLSWQNKLNNLDIEATSVNPYVTNGADQHFKDITTDKEIFINGLVSESRDFVFGSNANNSITGHNKNDHLYGGGGDDLINGGNGNDYIEGNAGQDTLNGGEGNDILIGGTEVDILDGGTGNDQLKGGAGADVYKLSGTYGTDFITDSDGLGIITIDNVALTGGVKITENIYRNESLKYTYTLSGTEGNQLLTISKDNDVNRIIVRNWSTTNSLNITLDNQEPVEKPVLMSGDLDKFNADGHYEFEYVTNNVPAENQFEGGHYKDFGINVDAQDVLQGDSIDDSIYGYGNSDALSGLGGDDYLNGGDGGDLIFGGMGKDTLVGGAGNDVIFGGHNGYFNAIYTYSTISGEDPEGQYTALYNSLTTPSDETQLGKGWGWLTSIETPDNGRPTFLTLSFLYQTTNYSGGGIGYLIDQNRTSKNLIHQEVLDNASDFDAFTSTVFVTLDEEKDEKNTILAGDGNDYVIGGSGDDFIDGGKNDDQVFGLGGSDIISGGDDNDILLGDGLLKDDYDTFESVKSYLDHGNDIIDGGNGDDYIYGQGGSDVLTGGNGKDIIFGDYLVGLLPNEYHGNDYLDGGSGNDELAGGGKDDIIYGGDGDDVLWGDNAENLQPLSAENNGKDYLDGGKGNDQLEGGGNDDILLGGDGNDYLVGDVKLHRILTHLA